LDTGEGLVITKAGMPEAARASPGGLGGAGHLGRGVCAAAAGALPRARREHDQADALGRIRH